MKTGAPDIGGVWALARIIKISTGYVRGRCYILELLTVSHNNI